MDLSNREQLPGSDSRLTLEQVSGCRLVGMVRIHDSKDNESALVGAMIVRLCDEIENLMTELSIARLDQQSCETRLKNLLAGKR